MLEQGGRVGQVRGSKGVWRVYWCRCVTWFDDKGGRGEVQLLIRAQCGHKRRYTESPGTK
jgi:hypothetical protein